MAKIEIVQKDKYNKARIRDTENCNNSSSFWKAINVFRPKRFNSCIDLNDWHEYLLNCYHEVNSSVNTSVSFPLLSIPILDEGMTTAKLLKVLCKCKSGKAPGLDGLNYDFYKSLTQNWIFYIEHLFNKVLSTEKSAQKYIWITTPISLKNLADLCY